LSSSPSASNFSFFFAAAYAFFSAFNLFAASLYAFFSSAVNYTPLFFSSSAAFF
jgi:hypothetical protein